MDKPGDIGQFYSLTPERVLDAVERSGQATTGLCYALNSLENRVYEVELDGQERIVAKFYRPGRWSRACILDEHSLLQALDEAEVPTCPPLPLPSGGTLEQTPEGIFFALFPRMGGRPLEELDGDGYERLGRSIARIHNVSAGLQLRHRPEISAATYGSNALEIALAHGVMSPSVRARYEQAARALIALGTPRFAGLPTFVVHGDCHRGNLLQRRDDWVFLDFDDSGVAPAVQDLWLLLPARVGDCPQELEAMLRGYQQMRDFPLESLGLIEVLRGLRYLRYAAWICSRWEDPAFKRAFPDFNSDRYWEQQLADLLEQVEQLRGDR